MVSSCNIISSLLSFANNMCSKAKSILTYKRPMFVYPRLHQCNLLRDKSANPSAICGECKQEHKPLTYKLLLWVHMSARSQNTAILDRIQTQKGVKWKWEMRFNSLSIQEGTQSNLNCSFHRTIYFRHLIALQKWNLNKRYYHGLQFISKTLRILEK